jgi:REP element-mobilizing transposase RayT
MPRGPRIELEGGIHHVFTRGDHRERIFDDDSDRHRFLRRYEVVAARYEWVPLSYCLMDNHVHLVLETPRCTLGDGCRDLLGHYARLRNGRLDELGHVYQGRFRNRLVQNEAYFAQLLRYVALNPVKANLCPTPESWPWSSHRVLRAGEDGPLARSTRVAELLDIGGGEPSERYTALFEPAHPLELQFGAHHPEDWRPTLQALFVKGEEAGLAAARAHGYTLAEIGGHLGVHRATVLRRLRNNGA